MSQSSENRAAEIQEAIRDYFSEDENLNHEYGAGYIDLEFEKSAVFDLTIDLPKLCMFISERLEDSATEKS